jgi:hypothetical protein
VIHDHGHAFRQAAGRFASGVTIVTTRASEGAYGVTVSSFASLSLNPLLVTVSINRSSPLLEYVRTARQDQSSGDAHPARTVGSTTVPVGELIFSTTSPGVRAHRRETSAPRSSLKAPTSDRPGDPGGVPQVEAFTL